MHYSWRVSPLAPPPVARHCRRCGNTLFHSSGQFRINAQQKHLDIWLIWQCEGCGQTWNMAILSRRPVRAIPRNQLEAYLRNDPALALRCAFDPALHRQNGTTPLLERVPYEVAGEVPLLSPSGQAVIHIECGVHFPIRLLAILSRKLGCSIGSLRRCAARGLLTSAGQRAPEKARLDGGATLCLTGSPWREGGEAL